MRAVSWMSDKGALCDVCGVWMGFGAPGRCAQCGDYLSHNADGAFVVGGGRCEVDAIRGGAKAGVEGIPSNYLERVYDGHC